MTRFSSVRTLIAIYAARKWPLLHMDVKNDFLNGELSEEVYMKLPPGYSHPPGFPHRVCRLRRTLYGLKQTPEHGLQSSVLLSLSMVFQAVLLIQLFFLDGLIMLLLFYSCMSMI